MPQPVRMVFLGGLGEIGRNCMAVEQGSGEDAKLLLIDCGLMFPDPTCTASIWCCPISPGCGRTPSASSACVATHGHEDHVGGLSYLLRELSFPIYGSALTLGLARNRIEEAGLLDRTALHTVADGERRMIGPFDVEFLPVTHSVPHAHAVAIHTPQGVILHTGDFKLDLTPVDGRRTDLARIGAIASTTGIRVLLADSTNAEEHGHAPSETSVGAVLRQLFASQRGRRVITASFASHLHRIQQIADAAIARALGGHPRTEHQEERPPGRRTRCAADPRRPSCSTSSSSTRYPPEQVCIISTGSQGEPMSALALLARGESKWVKVGDHDTVILSSHAIPGNEGNVNRVIDGLLRAGCEVIHSGVADVHATGHAQADELKTYLSIARPEWYVPIHGEYRHLVANAKLGVTMGVPRDQVLVCEDGDVLELTDAGLAMPGGCLPGTCTSTASSATLARACCATGVCWPKRASWWWWSPSTSSGKVLTGPEIITRGWVYAPEAEDLLDEACDRIADVVEAALASGVRDVESLERDVRRAAGRFVNERTKRRPMIVPVVMEA
jgi:ribonuclease J